MENKKLVKILNIIRENVTASGGSMAGLPPDDPPVDLRKRKKSQRPWLRYLRNKSNGKGRIS